MTESPAELHTEQVDPDRLLAAIRGNVFRLTTTTRVEYARDNPAAATASSRQRVQPIKATAYTEPLITALRDSIRPSQGATDSGRGSGANSLPFNDNASTLLATIEAEIAGMYRSGTDLEPIGTSEQLLLEWLREFEISYRTGDVVNEQLTNLLIRIRGWRFSIEDHFSPPRKREVIYCPACKHTHYETWVNEEITRQRCVIVTYRPGNTRRPPTAECGNCGARWVGPLELGTLNADISALLKKQEHALDKPIVARLTDPTDSDDETDDTETEGHTQ